MRRLSGIAASHLYLLFVSLLLYAWPNVLFFEAKSLRISWIAVSAVLVLVSTGALAKALRGASFPLPSLRTLPWVPMSVIGIPILILTTLLPMVTFGGESLFHLLAMGIAQRVLLHVHWTIPLLLLLLSLFVLFRYLPRFESKLLTGVLVSAFLLFGLATALMVDRTLLSRYPPLVHLLQLASIILSGETLVSYRLPTAFFTIMGIIVIFRLSGWTPLAKWATSMALMTTPIGWFYHLTLFQVPGDLFFALVAIFLTVRSLEEEETASAALLGAACAFWILYRETALAPACGIAGILLFARRFRHARTFALVFAPVALAWLLLFIPTSDYVRDLYTLPQLGARQASLVSTIFTTFGTFPHLLHPAGFIILLVCSAWVFSQGTSKQRLLLGVTWIIAITNIVLHMMIGVAGTAGYGRFNAFILLPLAFGIALSPFVPLLKERWRTPLAGSLIAALVVITPWDIVSFANSRIRKEQPDAERRVFGGLVYTLYPSLVMRHIDRAKTLIAIGTDAAFIDLLIADGKLTPEERTALLRRSDAWEPGDPGTPIIIHDPRSPEEFTYWEEQLSKEEQIRMHRLAEWAREQPRVKEWPMAGQTTLVVP